ncbi:kelch-like protein 7 [Paramacrobiotus metropolitanus]|uniref:kelch-like protein 7 n=1 Tax=Paramacrobiotus metropolitanus TaxID=2943436 RepID=UPI002445DC10|nr:kelch-like protein 7 [Paramacrobiotus metropolitanus]
MTEIMAACSSSASRKRRRLSEDTSLFKLDGSAFFIGLQNARHNFCDVSVCGTKGNPAQPAPWIPCHRNVLMARSGWFQRMLRSPMKESQQDTIQVHSVPHDILEQLIRYMYSFEISVDGGNALFLLQAADFLEMEQIVEVCKLVLKENLDTNNWRAIYRGAQHLSCTDVLKDCRAFALEHFTSISQSADFLDLDAAEVSQLVASDELNVEKEEQVATAVARWLAHSFEERLPHAVDIVGRIRVPLLTSDDIATLPDTPAGQHSQ